jgi:signal transduction histidine kinase/CheY-like chemotaxis protein/AraC-like DNA-binding protein
MNLETLRIVRETVFSIVSLTIIFLINTCNTLAADFIFDNGLKSLSKPTGIIRSLASIDDQLFVGAENGFFVITGSNYKFFDESNSDLGNGYVSSVKVDEKFRVWVTEYGGGVFKYSAFLGSFEQVPLPEYLSGRVWTALAFNQLLYIGLIDGIAVYNLETGDLQIFDKESGHKLTKIIDIHVLDDNVFFASKSNLIQFSHNGENISKFSVTDYFPKIGEISSMSIGDGMIFVGGIGGAYSWGLDKDAQFYSLPNWLETEKVRTILIGDKSNIWLGAGTLIQLNLETGLASQINTYNQNWDVKNIRSISAITKTSQNEIIVSSTQKGLIGASVQPNFVTVLHWNNGQYLDQIIDVEGGNEEQTIAISTAGLVSIDNATGFIKHIDKRNDSNTINLLAKDSRYLDVDKCEKLIHKSTKINLIDKCKFLTGIVISNSATKHYFHIESSNEAGFIVYEHPNISYIPSPRNIVDGVIDSNNRLIIINKKNDVFFQSESHVWIKESYENLRNSYVNCVVTHKGERIYLCISGRGYGYIDTKTRALYIIRKTIPKFIRSAYIDDEGYHWLATNIGLLAFQDVDNIFTLDASNGLKDLDFEYRGIYEVGASNILLVGDNYNYLIDTEILHQYFQNRLQRISHVGLIQADSDIIEKRFSSGTSRKNHIALASGADEITLTFASTDIAQSHAQHLEYRLVGLTEKWSTTEGASGVVNYASLPYGDYEFQARVIDNKSVREQPLYSLAISVPPPFWWTTEAFAFYALMACIFVLLGYLVAKKLIQIRNLHLADVLNHQHSALADNNDSFRKSVERRQTLFTNISHELRTPLMLIMGSLQHVVDAQKDDTHKSRFDVIHRNAQRLRNLVEQLMEIERIDFSKELPKQSYIVDKDVNFLVESLRTLATEKKQTLTLSCQASVQVYLLKDSLERILYNLIGNAVKYTPLEGEILVKVFLQDDCLVIKVKDNGEGISDDDMESVFKRYSRASKSEDGHGIGLAVTEEMIIANGGWIELSSIYGTGTEFHVHLPVTATPTDDFSFESKNKEIKEEITAALELNQCTKQLPVLLIVDDNEEVRIYLIELLQEEFCCFSAGNGPEAIQIAESILPDLIITDLKMPIMDGLALAKVIREKVITKHIPIILLTAKANSETRKESYKTLINDFQTKPFDIGEFKLRIRNLLKLYPYTKPLPMEETPLTLPISQVLPETPTLTNEKDQKFFLKFMQVLEKNYSDESFNRTKAADKLAMSERQLNRKLATILQHNFMWFLRELRLNKSKQKLQSGMGVTQVAYEVGFSSSSYFSACFKQVYGYTPSEYVVNVKKDV